MNRSRTIAFAGIAVLVIFSLAMLGFAIFRMVSRPRLPAISNATPKQLDLAVSASSTPELPPTAILDAATALAPGLDANLAPAPSPFPTPAPHTPENFSGAAQTLALLENAQIPVADPRLLAEELRGIKNIPVTVEAVAAAYPLGTVQKFWVSDDNTHKNVQVEAVLRQETPHGYFWIEKGLVYRESDLSALANAWEQQIYPTDRRFFGSELTPGVDNDPHIYIIYIRGLGGRLAGYFSSVDELHPLAHPYSNAHEAFFLNADTLPLNQANKILAHEFQHMIHWHTDTNEESWMNEGFSMLATLLNQYDVGSFDRLYAQDPDQQLNDWPTDPNERSSYYGSSFLFLAYFLDRIGEQATQAVVANPANGLDSIDRVLKDFGQKISADDVFADWAVTNYVQNPKIGDGRYAYHLYSNPPKMEPTESFDKCPIDWQDRTVHQYGTDYIQISCTRQVTLNFQGVREVAVLPENPHSGRKAFWSNRGDDSDSTLTHVFDFTKVNSPIEMSYWTWYDLEKDFDYVYLEASLDGRNWEILKPPACTQENVSGNSYGCGYNGQSGGWIEQTIDLSRFAGKQVQLRFETITDAAVTAEGFLLDDISIPAVGYSSDFEMDDGGWQPAGFVNIQNRLPQNYRVEVIKDGQSVEVEPLVLDRNGAGQITLNFGEGLKDVVLVVSGTTRYTRQEALYRFSITP